MKKLVALLAVFVGLGAFVYFYEIKGGEERDAAKEEEQSLLGLEQGQISTLEIQPAGKQPIVMGRIQGDWRITQPVQSSTDRFVIDGLLRDLTGAKKASSFPLESQDLKEYGLDQPAVVLRISASDGSQRTLKLGKEDYTGNNVYAQLDGQTDIYLTPKILLGAANKDLKEWRSKTVLDFDQDLARVIEIRTPAGVVELNRSEGPWTMTKPIQDPADETAVSSLMSSVRYARIERFAAETDEDLASYGLDQPQYVLRIREKGDDSFKELQLGRQDGESYFARNPGRPLIFTVRKDLADKLSQKPWEFRDKRVVDVEQDELDRFQMLRGQLKINILREGDAFTITFPDEQKGQNAPPYKFFYPATDAKFESLEEGPSAPGDPRFQSPDIVIETTLRDGTVKRFEFVEKSGKYLARQVQTGRTGEISKGAFDKLKYEPGSLTG